MAHKVEFIKKDIVNGKEYDKGEILSVSNSIYKALADNKSVKDFKEVVEEKKNKAKKEE